LYADEESRQKANLNADYRVVAVDLQEMAAIDGVAIV
jgi:hypothetical protein